MTDEPTTSPTLEELRAAAAAAAKALALAEAEAAKGPPPTPEQAQAAHDAAAAELAAIEAAGSPTTLAGTRARDIAAQTLLDARDTLAAVTAAAQTDGGE